MSIKTDLDSPILICQVFLNIIENTVKYSYKTDYPLDEVESSVKYNEVVYTIKDNGVGIVKISRQKSLVYLTELGIQTNTKEAELT